MDEAIKRSDCLFGDESVEFFFRNNSVFVFVSSLNHILENIVVGEFSEIFGNLSEILEGNES